MDTNRFFELLRSFTQLTSLQLERAQEALLIKSMSGQSFPNSQFSLS
ncbi:hypothetical protein VCX44_24245 [Aeromonas caviae]|uniref:Uncharacterized protein n=1 Tax=Aeromonas caviae TaxID=648 RepID=A0ABU5WD24_AERCA|nr:hypothetical protein [Aeromonas caviae]MEA9438812.1 hypothetical protein [Aeromonas caviae]